MFDGKVKINNEIDIELFLNNVNPKVDSYKPFNNLKYKELSDSARFDGDFSLEDKVDRELDDLISILDPGKLNKKEAYRTVNSKQNNLNYNVDNSDNYDNYDFDSKYGADKERENKNNNPVDYYGINIDDLVWDSLNVRSINTIGGVPNNFAAPSDRGDASMEY